jgi:hypothetical protein
MVKAKYGQIVSEMRGSVAGACFSRGKSGSVIRTKKSNHHKRSIKQINARSLFASVTQAWTNLSVSRRNAWNSQSVQDKKTDVFGAQISYSGRSFFNKCNMNLLTINETVILDPPVVTSVFAFSSFTVNLSVIGGTLLLNYSPAIDSNTKVLVYATPPVSSGITNVKNFYRLIAVLNHTSVSSYDCATEYINVFGSLGQRGQNISFKLIPIDINTGLSGASFVSQSFTSSVPYIFGRNVTLPSDGDSWLNGRIFLAGFSCTENAEIQNYGYYTWQDLSTNIKLALYDSSFNLVLNSVSDALNPPITADWRIFSISGVKPVISAGNDYYIALWSDTLRTYLKYKNGGFPLVYKTLAYTGIFPNSLTGLSSTGAYELSTYGNCLTL